MTVQVDFDSHTSTVALAAVALINEVTPGERRGRPMEGPNDAELRAAVERALSGADPRWTGPPDDAASAELAGWAIRLRQVVTRADEGDQDRACVELNAVLRESGAVPTLSRHDGEPWHLHFHTADAGWATGWAAGMATGLAMVLGSPAADRIGLCRAPACDRAYFDTSRNGTRRFCSTACQNRVKAAAFRARRAG